MSRTPKAGAFKALAFAMIASFSWSGCAARGHVATPGEMALLERSAGLSASGRITLKGPRGRLSTAVVFGVARPDSLRIEIPAGAGLRFLLVSKEGRLRADLPQDDAMYEGPATADVMERLFGIELDPKALVGAVLGSPPERFQLNWRFDRNLPSQVTIQNPRGATLALTLKDPEIEAPGARAFEFAPLRGRVWTLEEMSSRLGVTR